jgi:hypothetical protein
MDSPFLISKRINEGSLLLTETVVKHEIATAHLTNSNVLHEPVAYVDSGHLYHFATSSPTTFTDPSGLERVMLAGKYKLRLHVDVHWVSSAEEFVVRYQIRLRFPGGDSHPEVITLDRTRASGLTGGEFNSWIYLAGATGVSEGTAQMSADLLATTQMRMPMSYELPLAATEMLAICVAK